MVWRRWAIWSSRWPSSAARAARSSSGDAGVARSDSGRGRARCDAPPRAGRRGRRRRPRRGPGAPAGDSASASPGAPAAAWSGPGPRTPAQGDGRRTTVALVEREARPRPQLVPVLQVVAVLGRRPAGARRCCAAPPPGRRARAATGLEKPQRGLEVAVAALAARCARNSAISAPLSRSAPSMAQGVDAKHAGVVALVGHARPWPSAKLLLGLVRANDGRARSGPRRRRRRRRPAGPRSGRTARPGRPRPARTSSSWRRRARRPARPPWLARNTTSVAIAPTRRRGSPVRSAEQQEAAVEVGAADVVDHREAVGDRLEHVEAAQRLDRDLALEPARVDRMPRSRSGARFHSTRASARLGLAAGGSPMSASDDSQRRQALLEVPGDDPLLGGVALAIEPHRRLGAVGRGHERRRRLGAAAGVHQRRRQLDAQARAGSRRRGSPSSIAVAKNSAA